MSAQVHEPIVTTCIHAPTCFPFVNRAIVTPFCRPDKAFGSERLTRRRTDATES
jgi:hypothetical protein